MYGQITPVPLPSAPTGTGGQAVPPMSVIPNNVEGISTAPKGVGRGAEYASKTAVREAEINEQINAMRSPKA